MGGGSKKKSSKRNRWAKVRQSRQAGKFAKAAGMAKRKQTFRQVSRQLSAKMAEAGGDSKWEKKTDPKSKRPYWVHKLTKKSVWKDPTDDGRGGRRPSGDED